MYVTRERTALDKEVAAFLADREARGLSPGTLRFYTQKLSVFRHYLQVQGVEGLQDVDASLLRGFLRELAASHTAGGVHAHYRALRALLTWYALEVEGWTNPIVRVPAPRVPQMPLEPVPLGHVRAMLEVCRGKSLTARRDRAVLLALLDTGCRASELIALDVEDLDPTSGAVLIRRGKGGKVRTVCLGRQALRAVQTYLRMRDGAPADPLFATVHGLRLRYESLRDIVRRRARQAGIPIPTLHSFRRAFALECLRNGMDVFSLQRLLGHASLSIVRTYLAQTSDDVQRAHRQSGPVDRMLAGGNGRI